MVVSHKVDVTGVSLDKSSAQLFVGGSLQLTATVTPDNATFPEVAWSSSNPAVATVSETGEVTAVASGTADITVRTEDGNKTDVCAVTVKVQTDGVQLSKDNLELVLDTEKATGNITAKVLPDTLVQDVTYVSSDPAVATVDDNGLVTAVSKGTATITVTDTYKNSSTCAVTVKQGVTAETSISPTSVELVLGSANETAQITVTPNEGADDVNVGYESSDSKVFTVDSNGLVTAKGDGTASVTITVNGAGESQVTKTVPVSVTSIVTGLTLTESLALTLNTDNSEADLAYTVTPAGKAVSFVSSDKDVVTVDGSGHVTAVGKGNATITATAGNFSQVCNVNVSAAPASIQVSPNRINLGVGESQTIDITVDPNADTQTDVTASANKANVASWDILADTATITGVAEGETVITFTTENGEQATCTVQVVSSVAQVASVSLPASAWVMNTEGASLNLAANASVMPNNADQTLTWTSSDPSVAKVDENGVVTPVAVGSATITATAVNDVSGTCLVSVRGPVTHVDVTMEGGYRALKVGESFTLKAQADGDVNTAAVNWRASQAGVVSELDKSADNLTGSGTATGNGTVTVTVYAPGYGGSSAYGTIDLTVYTGLKSVSAPDMTLNLGQSQAIRLTSAPVDAEITGVSYVSKNTDIATVSPDGVVTPVGFGETVIDVTARDAGGAEVTASVKVKVEVADIDVSAIPATLDLAPGETSKALAVTVQDKTDAEITYASSDPTVATVDDAGKVTAVANGTSTITVTVAAKDGSSKVTKTSVVSVATPVTGVTVTPTTVSLSVGGRTTLGVAVQPATASRQGVTWTSGNEDVATVTATGVVVAIGEGTTDITAVTDDGGFKAVCTVTVTAQTYGGGGGGGGTGSGTGTAAATTPGTIDLDDGEVPLADLPLVYEDVADTAWYRDAVAYVDHNKLMNGVSDTLFAPNGKTNRAMVATVLYRLENNPSVEEMENIFSDVLEGMYYTEAVTWAADVGIITGYGDDTFRPTNQITREELAAILYRYAAYKGYDTSATADLTTFADADSVGKWSVEYMQWAVGTGLIQGKDGNMIDAKGTATRAQVATILMRFNESFRANA
jgi:uncharacterized protein YjdB